jgi:hypothetical protein
MSRVVCACPSHGLGSSELEPFIRFSFMATKHSAAIFWDYGIFPPVVKSRSVLTNCNRELPSAKWIGVRLRKHTKNIRHCPRVWRYNFIQNIRRPEDNHDGPSSDGTSLCWSIADGLPAQWVEGSSGQYSYRCSIFECCQIVLFLLLI